MLFWVCLRSDLFQTESASQLSVQSEHGLHSKGPGANHVTQRWDSCHEDKGAYKHSQLTREEELQLVRYSFLLDIINQTLFLACLYAFNSLIIFSNWWSICFTTFSISAAFAFLPILNGFSVDDNNLDYCMLITPEYVGSNVGARCKTFSFCSKVIVFEI